MEQRFCRTHRELRATRAVPLSPFIPSAWSFRVTKAAGAGDGQSLSVRTCNCLPVGQVERHSRRNGVRGNVVCHVFTERSAGTGAEHHVEIQTGLWVAIVDVMNGQ